MSCATEFIPVQAGQWNLIGSQDMLSDLLGQVVYWQSGNLVTFHRDIKVDGVDAVTVKLVLMDLAACDEYTPLPLSADLENQIIMEVYQSFLPVQAQPRIVDAFNDNLQPQGK